LPNDPSSGSAVYNLTGGELWWAVSPASTRRRQARSRSTWGGRVYPYNAGFEIWGNVNPVLTGVNGPTRFCSDEENLYTSYLGNLTGPGGMVKEGSDTLIFSGVHTFTGPVIVSNGTLIVDAPMSGTNDVTVAGGTMSVQNVAVKFRSLHIEGGVFETAAGSAVSIAGGADHWVRVSGGRFRMLGGDLLSSVAVSGAGLIELGQGVAASVLRLSVNGTDLEPGLYTAANCPAITGAGTLAVKISGKPIADTFTRADGPVANDSLGSTEAGGADWHEFKVNNFTVNAASIENGELRLGDGTSDPCLAVASASWPSGVFSARMRFNKVDGSGATVKNGCGLVMRRALGSRLDIEADMAGSVSLLMTPAGALFVRENALDTKYGMNPFTGSPDFWVYGSAGSLPASINGLPFDADGDGRLGDSEPFDFQAILSGSRLQVLVNGQPVMAANGFAPGDPVADNCPGFFKNRLDSGAAETHDVLFDNYSVTNLPYVIRHIGAFDPNVGAALPVENWTVAGDAGAVAVGPVTETVGGQRRGRCMEGRRRQRHGFRLLLDGALGGGGRMGEHQPLAHDAADAGGWQQRCRGLGRVPIVAGSGTTPCCSAATLPAMRRSVASAGRRSRWPGGSVYHTYTLQYSPVHSRANLHCDGEPLALSIPWAEGGGDRLFRRRGFRADRLCGITRWSSSSVCRSRCPAHC
jgi:autotransporter-associated beta strand protein